MKFLLSVLAVLMMWGPPRLRVDPRPLGTALEDPLALDVAALFQVAVWGGSALFIALILAGRAIAGKRLVPRLLWSSSLKLYLAFGVAAMASTAYSVSPYYTAFFAGKIILSVFTVALLTDRADLETRWPLVLKLFIGTNIGAWLLNVTFLIIDPRLVGLELPNIGYRLSGGIFQDYGKPAAVAGLFFLTCIVFYSRGPLKMLWSVLYAVTWVFIGLSRTRSTVVGAIAMLGLVVAFSWSRSSRTLAVCVAGILLLGIVATESVEPIVAYGMRGQSVDSLLTLTGRTNAFDYLLQQWNEAPWLGLGYAAGSRFLLVEFVRDTGLGIGSAHDAVSKVLVEMGIVGSVILLIVFLAACREVAQVLWAARSHYVLRPLAATSCALFVYFTLESAVSGGIADVPYPFLIVSCCTALLRSRLSMARPEPARTIAPQQLLPAI